MYGQLTVFNLDGSILIDETIESLPAKIGRTPPNEIVINHQSISREHAVIEMQSDKLIIKDLKSTNGMHLKGMRVSAVNLNSSVEFQIGDLKSIFTSPMLVDEKTVVSSYSKISQQESAPEAVEKAKTEKTEVSQKKSIDSFELSTDLQSEKTHININNLNSETRTPIPILSRQIPSSIPSQTEEDEDIFSAKTIVRPTAGQKIKAAIKKSISSKTESDTEEEVTQHGVSDPVAGPILLIAISIIIPFIGYYLTTYETIFALKHTGISLLLSVAISYIYSYLSKIKFIKSNVIISSLNMLIFFSYLISLLLVDEYQIIFDILLLCILSAGMSYLIFQQIDEHILKGGIDKAYAGILILAISLLIGFLVGKEKVNFNFTVLSKYPAHLWKEPDQSSHSVNEIFKDIEKNWN